MTLARSSQLSKPSFEKLIRHPGNGGPEVQFALDMLRLIGPDSPDGAKFAVHYLSLAEALAAVREAPGKGHPRLILQEANLRREYVVRGAQRKGEFGLDEGARLKILRGTRDILESALDGLAPVGIRQNLLVELASTLGAEAWELSQIVGSTDTSVALLARRIVEIVNQARAIEPENYYPVDVIGWVCLTIVRNAAVTADIETGLVADMMAAFSSIDTNALSPNQRARYDSRLAEVTGLMNDVLGQTEHLDVSALELGSGCLRSARSPLFELAVRRSHRRKRSARSPGFDGCSICRTSRLALCSTDARSFWLARTGKRFLQGEREALAFGDDDWNACLNIIEQVAADPRRPAPRPVSPAGCHSSIFGQYGLAIDSFSELERTTSAMSRRVIATYVASSSDGKPVEFTGQVRFVSPDLRRGRVWVEAIGR